MNKDECIKVMVRVRPLNRDEINRKCNTVVKVNQDKGEIIIS